MATEVTIKTNKQTSTLNKLDTVINAAKAAMKALSSEELKDLGAAEGLFNDAVRMKQWADNCFLVCSQDRML